MTWIPCPQELRSNPEPTCPICDAALRRLASDPFALLRCDKCEMVFTSPETDEMSDVIDAINEADADEVGRCRVCGAAEYDHSFEGRHWVPDPQGAFLCNRCA